MKDHNFTKLQQKVYDAIMRGENVIVSWPIGIGKTYLYNAIREDLKAIYTAFEEHFKGEKEN